MLNIRDLELIITALIGIIGNVFAWRSWLRYRYDLLYPILAVVLLAGAPYFIFPLYLYAEERNGYGGKYGRQKVWAGWSVVLFGMATSLAYLWPLLSQSEMELITVIKSAHLSSSIAVLLYLPIILTIICKMNQAKAS